MTGWSWLKATAAVGVVAGGIGGVVWWKKRSKSLSSEPLIPKAVPASLPIQIAPKAPTPYAAPPVAAAPPLAVPPATPPAPPKPPPAPAAPPPAAGSYPPGPYGFSVGNVYPNVAAMGLRNGLGGEYTKISMADYYDPTGARGVNAIYVDLGLTTCMHCRDEARNSQNFYSSLYQPRGVKFISALADVLADSSRKFVPPGDVKTPHHVIIDPRTMKVVAEWDGWPKGAEDVFASYINPLLAKSGV
jgi:hypothetical protein